jgi:hypothetical protein
MINDIITQQWLENIKSVQNNIENKQYQYKIEQFIKRTGNIFTKEEIIINVKNNDLVAAMFAKNPVKQNIYESKIPDSLKDVCKLNKLPNGNKNSLRFNKQGKLVSGKITDIENYSKSVDFSGTINNKKFYFTQKYTQGKGGAQDNQYRDILQFIDYAIQNKERGYGVGIIIDGDYYINKIDVIKERYKDVKDFMILQAFDNNHILCNQ